jgi:hypothetical protein
LIKNSIICWSYLYLARQIQKAPDENARLGLLHSITNHSPMSWAHINMLGEYNFPDEKLRDTLGALLLGHHETMSAKGSQFNYSTLCGALPQPIENFATKPVYPHSPNPQKLNLRFAFLQHWIRGLRSTLRI